jgi:hypothetical protein
MLWVIRVLVFFGYGISSLQLVFGVAALANRNWRIALARLGSSVLAFVASGTLCGLGMIAFVVTSDRHAIPPEQKAFALGRTIATAMNFGAAGFVLGLAVGAGLLLKRRLTKVP